MTELESKVVYTIMPDFGMSPWAWVKDNNNGSLVGICITGESGWDGEHPISITLEQDFIQWAKEFDHTDLYIESVAAKFDWKDFHERGIALTKRLKTKLGAQAIVNYVKPFEDPSEDRNECFEVNEDGSLRMFIPCE